MIPERVQAQRPASLAVRVASPAGAGLPSMRLELGEQLVRYTNQKGRYRFKGLAAGAHRLQISFPNYPPIDTVLQLKAGERMRFTAEMAPTCRQYHAEAARADLAAGRVLLLHSSGIAAVVYTTDSLFEATYQVRYVDFGCVVPDDQSCLQAYNRVVFAHLDSLYGKVWRKSVRPDVLDRSPTFR